MTSGVQEGGERSCVHEQVGPRERAVRSCDAAGHEVHALSVVPKKCASEPLPERGNHEHSMQPFARGVCEPLHAERLASHGERRRAQVEAIGGTPAEQASREQGAGGEPSMPSPGRVGGQWSKSIWVMAALSALPNKDQLTGPDLPRRLERRAWPTPASRRT